MFARDKKAVEKRDLLWRDPSEARYKGSVH
jgi:hypothetical protein